MFDLHKLGWHSFQQLCLTILREVLGQTVESFLASSDGGRDGAFSGTWQLAGNEDLSGVFVFQCKHTNRMGHNLSLADITDEIAKAKKLVESDRCDCYILITNAGISGTANEEIIQELMGIGVKKAKVFGATWISDQIRDSKKLRMLVPRVYGLGDLSEILDARAYEQAKVLLEAMREDLAKVVLTSTYYKAVDAINKHGLVLLIGEPAAGKTTIASLLSMASLDQWGTYTMKEVRASVVVDRWNPNDSRQFFWIDDAFGVTQYELSLAYEWNSFALKLNAMLRTGVKIVMTSRDYIYNKARKDLKKSAFPLIEESQVVIDVHNLSIEEKKQILYNHLKLGTQSKEFRSEIKPHLENISKLEGFVPETARRLSDPIFTKNLIISDYWLTKFVEKPEEFLRDVIEGLDNDSKAALALIYMRNDNLESPIVLSESESVAIERLGSSLGGCTSALENLRNSLVYLIPSEDMYFWKFKHPTISDAYSVILKRNPELLEIYIQGSSPEELTGAVTCGNVGLEKSVVLGRKFFPLIITKLKNFKSSTRHKTELWSTWEAKRRLHSFLANRCSREFLQLYLAENPEVLQDITKPELYLEYSPSVKLVIRLNDLGILPNDTREKFTKCISDYAIAGDDFYILSSKELRDICTKKEWQNLRRKIREVFLTSVDTWREEKESGFSDFQSPKDHMARPLESLKLLKKTFAQIKFTYRLDEQINLIEDWIIETEKKSPEPIAPRERLDSVEQQDNLDGSRSIFDDIDD
ncbi:MAG: restriction endonuclease [Chitinophagaceae bacterium]